MEYLWVPVQHSHMSNLQVEGDNTRGETCNPWGIAADGHMLLLFSLWWEWVQGWWFPDTFHQIHQVGPWDWATCVWGGSQLNVPWIGYLCCMLPVPEHLLPMITNESMPQALLLQKSRSEFLSHFWFLFTMEHPSFLVQWKFPLCHGLSSLPQEQVFLG